MSHRFSIGLLALVLLVFNVSAQFYPFNARIEALGETYIINDMTDILRYSAYMRDYEDDFQVTFGSPGAVGPIFGIKSMGEVINLGIVANGGNVLSQAFAQDFYSTALGQLNNVADPGLSTPSNIPHLLFGVNAGAVSLGLDIFVEYGHTNLHNETTGTVTDTKGTINNPGAVASVLLGSEEMPIAIKAGASWPHINGESEIVPPAPGTPVTNTVSSESGLYLEFGAEAAIPVSDFKMNFGGTLIRENYSFDFNGTTGTEFTNYITAAYAGVDMKVFMDGVFGVMYDFQLFNRNAETGGVTTYNSNIFNLIKTGLENVWSDVWIFDNIAARGGLVLVLSTPITGSDGPGDDTNRAKSQTTFSQLFPTVGLGVSKNVFDLDVTIDPTSWAGAIAGPGVSLVTATFRF